MHYNEMALLNTIIKAMANVIYYYLQEKYFWLPKIDTLFAALYNLSRRLHFHMYSQPETKSAYAWKLETYIAVKWATVTVQLKPSIAAALQHSFAYYSRRVIEIRLFIRGTSSINSSWN